MKIQMATIGLIVALGAPAYASSPSSFVDEAIKGDNSEIALGKLAQKQAASQGVRDFGATLVTDHTKARQEMVAAGKSLGVTPSDAMTPDGKEAYDMLAGKSGKDFDTAFVSHMVDDHKKDIAKFEEEAKANDAKASSLAKQQLPTLKKHLATAQSLQRK